ncbi:secreted protein, acidic, cysteine-rich isoform X2 [Arctopsyche grandis]|uniref:secreted protein, acidic, cysteine-rich isoform X2 n=1 Tax=Arctopsyche grandis TaxID=121162 RepID=UPI00406D8072
MKGKKIIFFVMLFAFLCLDVSAEKVKRIKKVKKNRLSTTEQPPTSEIEADRLFRLENLEREHEQKYHASEIDRVKYLENRPQSSNDFKDEHNEVFVDVCSKVHCSAGRVCELDKDGEPQCVCISECRYETDERRKVCANNNETWPSDCEVHRQRCLCLSDVEGCKGPQYKHLQIDYYGVCRKMPECSLEEMSDFPRRMRDWLFNIMMDLADRQELSNHYMQMEKEAESNLTRRWVNAAIWKWCDLDANDNDRFVSRHELFPIRAPLLSLEHCIGPFLNNCDYDDDHRITLSEWGKCLELDENDLEDRCDEVTSNY